MTDNILNSFHPAVRTWFERKFRAPTDAQALGWPEIISGRDTLISAPTGSGKTLAAFLVSIDRLIREAEKAPLADEVHVLYISPLKALSNDIQRNLEDPLAEIEQVALELGYPSHSIRTALRTGDTTQAERQAIVKTPPHILITTPESLYLMLTAERSREILRTVKTVIVDEIHALLRDKRGSHLALSLARLDHIAASALPASASPPPSSPSKTPPASSSAPTACSRDRARRPAPTAPSSTPATSATSNSKSRSRPRTSKPSPPASNGATCTTASPNSSRSTAPPSSS